MNARLLRGITAQALHDYLRYSLDIPLIHPEGIDEFDVYTDAVKYLCRQPKIASILAALTVDQKKSLLNALEDQWATL